MPIYNDSYCVYAHINKINGKIYIGVTKYGNNPNKRWKNGNGYLDKNENGEYKQPHFAYAIIKYGWDGFDHEVIANKLTKEEADNFEELLVAELHLTDGDFGYNGRNGGGSHGSHSEETKRKISEAHKGLQFSEEHRKALSEAMKGIKQSEETINKRVEKLRGKKRSEEFKKRLSEIAKKNVTPESIANLIERNHRRWEDPEERLKQSIIMRGKRGKPVFCIELNKIFLSAGEVERELGIHKQSVSACCHGKRESAGKHPQTGEKLHWMYVEDMPSDDCNIFEMYKKEAVLYDDFLSSIKQIL